MQNIERDKKVTNERSKSGACVFVCASSATVSNVQIFDVASVHVKWILQKLFNLNDFDAILLASCVFLVF